MSQKTNHSFASLLGICRAGAEEVMSNEKEVARKIEEHLAEVYTLRKHVRSHRDARRQLRREYEAAGIRITGSTPNKFVPLLKLIYPAELARPTLGRYAGALWLAEVEEVGADGFLDFVREKGGVTASAKLAAQKRAGAADRPAPTDVVRQRLKKREADAVPLPRLKGLKLPRRGLHLLLLRCTKDGAVAFGHRPASDREASALLRSG